MKKIITFCALLLSYSLPGLVNAQSNLIHSFGISNHEKLAALNFIKNISFISSFTPKIVTKKEPKSTVTDKKLLDTLSINAIEKLSPEQVKYAMMMDVDVESIANCTLYDFVDSWYGTRYRMGGTTKKGIDCSAFTKSLLLAVYALAIPRTARDQYKNCEHINKDELLEGDLVFFNTRGGISHVGVFLINGYFVHSSASQGVMISNLADSYYDRRFIGAGRSQNK